MPKRVFTSKSIPHILTLLLLGLAIYVLAPKLASLKDSLNVIRQMSPLLVVLALGTQVASYWGSGYLMQASIPPRHDRFSRIDGKRTVHTSWRMVFAQHPVGPTCADCYNFANHAAGKGQFLFLIQLNQKPFLKRRQWLLNWS